MGRATMEIELAEAGPEDRHVLENLFQLYQYDFSEIIGGDTGSLGLYGYIAMNEFEDEPGHHAYLVKVGGKYAGFALVVGKSHFTGDPTVIDMDEFFVMRKYRRQGVGREVVRRLFDMFPGRWEVREVEPNTAAIAFWRGVIGEYTGGKYEERTANSERWQGPYQSFDTSIRVAG